MSIIAALRKALSPRALVVGAWLGLAAGGCKIDAVQTPTCVTDRECGAGNACIAGACIPRGVPQQTWAVEVVPRSDSSAGTTRFPAVSFTSDVTALTADAKVTVSGVLAPGASVGGPGASHLVTTVQTVIPGYTDLQFETDSSLNPGATDAGFTFSVPAGTIGQLASFRLIPLPPRDLAQPPVTIQARLARAVTLGYSSNYYFISGRLVSPAQQPLAGYSVRAFQGGQLVSDVKPTSAAGQFRTTIPVEAGFATSGQTLTIELSTGGDVGAPLVRFVTPPLSLGGNIDLGDLSIPVVPATGTYRFQVSDPSGQPIAGAVVRAHTDISFDRSGGIDFTRDGTTDPSGNVELPLVAGTEGAPRRYDIALLPPPTSRFGSTCLTGFAITATTPISTGSATAIAASLSMPQKAMLPGTILSAAGAGVAGVTIAATRAAGDPGMTCGKLALVSPPASATTGRDGSYQLLLDPGTYQFDYDPPAGAPVPRLTEVGIGVGAGANTARVVQLLPGALVKGEVRGPDGAPLAFAGVRFLEVVCSGPDACFGPDRVVPILRADTHSDADGSFSAVVPSQLSAP
jgi:hypothetical protein